MAVLKALSSFLPPPQYLLLPSAGVDISDTSLKYIQFSRDRKSGKNLVLRNWGDIDIPEGVLARGDVQDPAKLAEAIRTVRERTGVEFVRVSLPEERAYLFETEIKKGTPFSEIRGQLEFKLEENVPLSPRDAYFDYHVFDNTVDTDSMTVSVTVYAKETINGYYDACRAAGVTPLSFEVEAQAIARAAVPAHDTRTHLIVDFGKTRTGIGIVHRGILMYTSTIDIGGKELSGALRRQLGDKEESELTTIKNTQGLVRKVDDPAVYEALVSTMSAIKDEIGIRIQYWNSKRETDKDRFIENLILCGGSSNLRGLPEYFTETLGIQAERASVWRNAFSLDEFIPPIDRPHSYGYATAIGLGLVNLV